MSDAPLPDSAKTIPPTNSPAKTEARPAVPTDTDVSVPLPGKISAPTIGLGVLSAVLLLLVIVCWTEVGARDQTILEGQNRLEQVKVSASQIQTKVDEAKVASLKRQGEVETAHAQTAVLQTQYSKAKTDAAEL